jgi:hypothetical protein
MAYRKARAVELFMLAFFAKYNAILHDSKQAVLHTVLHTVSRLHAYSMLHKGNKRKKPETYTETRGQMRIFY